MTLTDLLFFHYRRILIFGGIFAFLASLIYFGFLIIISFISYETLRNPSEYNWWWIRTILIFGLFIVGSFAEIIFVFVLWSICRNEPYSNQFKNDDEIDSEIPEP
uniref:Uncharacterized protein n=1 Tax=Panagrolaimus sp. JU765 TaxID=591449 RepID=A0AC34R8H6_9BILA